VINSNLFLGTVSDEQKELFRNRPEKYLAYRKDIEAELNVRFKAVSPTYIWPYNGYYSKTDYALW